MEAPPQTPLPPPPRRFKRFGRTTCIIVLAPMVLLGVGMAVAGGLHLGDSSGYFGFVYLAACLCSIVGSAFVCVGATQSIVGRIFVFILSAVVLLVSYTVCIFAGCGAVNGPMNFH